jgi:hypothetical protein
MVSPAPFFEADATSLREAAAKFGFDIQASPWTPATGTRAQQVTHATSIAGLNAAVYDREFDFTPPTDARPFFFNILKPRAVLHHAPAPSGGVAKGNLVATSALLALLAIVTGLVVFVIGWPLILAGRPQTPPGVFGWGLMYFACIGLGFMFIQIPFLQRFSVYLGHPTYTFSVILFLMILSAGAGSFASERIDVGRNRSMSVVPLAIGAGVLAETWLLQAAIDRTIGWQLPGRTLVVAAFVVPIAFALGLCFPIGMRLVGRHSARATAWMWGVNGACSVLASIVAVMVSLWLGIQTNLIVAAGLYALLTLPMRRLAARL